MTKHQFDGKEVTVYLKAVTALDEMIAAETSVTGMFQSMNSAGVVIWEQRFIGSSMENTYHVFYPWSEVREISYRVPGGAE